LRGESKKSRQQERPRGLTLSQRANLAHDREGIIGDPCTDSPLLRMDKNPEPTRKTRQEGKTGIKNKGII